MSDDADSLFMPSSVPSPFPSLLDPSSYPSSQPTSNVSSAPPTSFPSLNVSQFPSSRPSSALNDTITNAPSPSPHVPYDIVQDITNPKKFNFVAMALSVSLLLVVVAVTIYGFLQRYTIVRKKSKAARYRHLRANTAERMEMYFAEDVGTANDTNGFTKNMYKYSAGSLLQPKKYSRLAPPIGVTTTESFVQHQKGVDGSPK